MSCLPFKEGQIAHGSYSTFIYFLHDLDDISPKKHALDTLISKENTTIDIDTVLEGFRPSYL